MSKNNAFFFEIFIIAITLFNVSQILDSFEIEFKVSKKKKWIYCHGLP